MKKIQDLNDARQIPKKEDIVASKLYHDILYSYFQEHSLWDGKQGHKRYIDASIINYTKIGKQLHLSRQTIAKKFKNLIALNLITEIPDEKGRYYLTILSSDVAALIPSSTLQMLIDTLSQNSISTYIYLLRRYVGNEEKPFIFTLNEVKAYIGICATTRSNDNVITNILYALQKLDLIKYHLTTLQTKEHGYDDIKTVYSLDFLTNDLDKKEEDKIANS